MTEQPHAEAARPQGNALLDSLGELDEGARDFVERLLSWSREIIVAILVVVAGGYLYRSYQAGQIQKDRLAGDRLGKVQLLFEEAALAPEDSPESETAKPEESKTTALKENIRLLSDVHEPYKSLSSLYQASLLRSEGDLPGALAALEPVASTAGSEGAQAFISELGALASARIVLDTEGKRSEGRESLRKLAMEASFVAVPAALSLANTAAGDSEERAALEVLKAVTMRQPEQRDLLSSEITRLEQSLAPAE